MLIIYWNVSCALFAYLSTTYELCDNQKCVSFFKILNHIFFKGAFKGSCIFMSKYDLSNF